MGGWASTESKHPHGCETVASPWYTKEKTLDHLYIYKSFKGLIDDHYILSMKLLLLTVL